jgi:hypothetical protein
MKYRQFLSSFQVIIVRLLISQHCPSVILLRPSKILCSCYKIAILSLNSERCHSDSPFSALPFCDSFQNVVLVYLLLEPVVLSLLSKRRHLFRTTDHRRSPTLFFASHVI